MEMWDMVDHVVESYQPPEDGGPDGDIFCYAIASKPGYKVVGPHCHKAKGSPGGEFVQHPEYGGPIGEYIHAGPPHHERIDSKEERLLFWSQKHTEGSWEDLMGLKIASTRVYLRRVGDGVPQWVKVADRREGDWMVPCVVLEGGAIVYPKNSKYHLFETIQEGSDDVYAAPYAHSPSDPRIPRSGNLMDHSDMSGVKSKDLLISALEIASKGDPPAEAAEADDALSKEKKPKRKNSPAADGETPEKKPKVDSTGEKEKLPISTISEAD